MTEYELIDAMSSLRSEAGLHVMNFVYVMFGYIVAAYLVGAKLSRFQVSVVTIIYAIWAPGPIMAAVDSAVALQGLYTSHRDALSINMGASPLMSNVPIIVGVGSSFSWVMSIVFMYQVRASNTQI